MTPSALQSGVLLSKSFPQQLVLNAVHLPHQHDALIDSPSCVMECHMGCEFSSGNLGLLSWTQQNGLMHTGNAVS
jgi:hypothetical protein